MLIVNTYEDKVLLQIEDCHRAVLRCVSCRLEAWAKMRGSKCSNNASRAVKRPTRRSGALNTLSYHFQAVVSLGSPHLPRTSAALLHGAAMAGLVMQGSC